MADTDLYIVKDDERKALVEEGLRELVDAGEVEIFTQETFANLLLKIFGPRLDVIGEGIENVNKYIARLKGKEPEPEAEEEIEVPDMGDVIAEAALETWHRKSGGLEPRKRVVKPDPPGLVTNEPLEHIEPPEDDAGLIEAAKRTWNKGRSLFGGD